MATLDDKAIARYVGLYWAGVTNPSKGAVRTAIVLAESGGDTTIRNACCTGLAQIHYVHAGGPPGSPRDREAFRTWLEDPVNNMKAARWVEDRQGLGAWEAYTNGRYREFADRATKATNEVAGTAGPGGDLSVGDVFGDIVSGVTDPVETLGQIVQNVGDVFGRLVSFITDPNTWKRVALGVGGVTVVLIGANIIARPVTTQIASEASSVVPAGKVAAAVKGR